jgi:hypothetical protein
MIHEIAKNDYENDVAEHELGILKQLAPKPALGLPTWISIGEVLWLEQVSEPADVTGHSKRLFGCTILLRNVAFVTPPEAGEANFFVELQAASVIQLVRSAIVLGSAASRLALGFLLWLHDKQSHPMLCPFVSFGVLLLQIQEDLAPASLVETVAWVEAEENSARERLGREVHSERWLVGLHYQEDSRKDRARWTNTLAQAITVRSGQLPPDVESTLSLMIARMSE